MKGEKEEKERKEKITHQIQFHGLVLRTEFTKQRLRGVAVGAVGFGEDDYSPYKHSLAHSLSTLPARHLQNEQTQRHPIQRGGESSAI